MSTFRCTTLLALMLALAAIPASAQDNFEIQVYGAELVPKGATMVEIHSNFTRATGVALLAIGQYSTRHAMHETLEITHGFADFFELGYYNFTSFQPGQGFTWVGTHIRPRFSVPESWHWPVGVSFSQEIGYQRKEFSPDTWTWEFRPIVDQKIGRFYWSVNPAFGLSLAGAGKGQGLDFSPNVQVNVDVSKRLNFGLEYYGSFGPIRHVESFNTTEQELFPAINYDFGPEWEFNIAAGIALTDPTDRLLFKMIVGHRFGGKK
jgi:hypothetical protein